jgi:hypothetical protein
MKAVTGGGVSMLIRKSAVVGLISVSAIFYTTSDNFQKFEILLTSFPAFDPISGGSTPTLLGQCRQGFHLL